MVSPLASRAVRAEGSMLVTTCWASSSIPRAASPSRNICATSPVTGTGFCIGKTDEISTRSSMPRCLKCSWIMKAPSNGAGGHLNGCPSTVTSTLPPPNSSSVSRRRSAPARV
jgi:hypothetical protein